MEKLEVLLVYNYLLLFLIWFVFGMCKGCDFMGYIYGGYCCNELGCGGEVFYKECGEVLLEINYFFYFGYFFKLFSCEMYLCSLCGELSFLFGYFCLICNFKLDLDCVSSVVLFFIFLKFSVYEYLFEFCFFFKFVDDVMDCKVCGYLGFYCMVKYKCV